MGTVMSRRRDRLFHEMLAQADQWAEISNDPTTKCGAVVFARDSKVFGVGWNHFPQGVVEDHRLHDRQLKNDLVVHAEPDAILDAGRPLYNCYMAVNRMPCCRCAGIIIQSGITKVVTRPPSGEFLERWGKSIELTKAMFAEAGVELVLLGD